MNMMRNSKSRGLTSKEVILPKQDKLFLHLYLLVIEM